MTSGKPSRTPTKRLVARVKMFTATGDSVWCVRDEDAKELEELIAAADVALMADDDLTKDPIGDYEKKRAEFPA